MEIFRISEKEQGRRLDVYMTEKKHWPRFFFMKALKNRKLKVNGKKEDPSYRLAAGGCDHLLCTGEKEGIGRHRYL